MLARSGERAGTEVEARVEGKACLRGGGASSSGSDARKSSI